MTLMDKPLSFSLDRRFVDRISRPSTPPSDDKEDLALALMLSQLSPDDFDERVAQLDRKASALSLAHRYMELDMRLLGAASAPTRSIFRLELSSNIGPCGSRFVSSAVRKRVCLDRSPLITSWVGIFVCLWPGHNKTAD